MDCRVLNSSMELPARECRNDVALAVDLDNTMLKSDLLLESALELLGRRPWLVVAFPIWLFLGKARLKREIAARTELDVAHLPWDERVIGLVRNAAGHRQVLLCTASDEKLASAVAEHFGAFDAVVASDGRCNLSGQAKASALSERCGVRGFDYIGNERVDLRVWASARRAIVVNGPTSLVRAAAQVCEVESHLPAEHVTWRHWAKALRVHQWLKNLLIFVPMLAAHRFYDTALLIECVIGFVAFGLCASGTYVLNDLLDLQADRQHPSKRERPFAAGQLALAQGVVISPLLIGAAFAISLSISPPFAGVLAAYFVLTLCYSLWLKKQLVADVVVLAGLYTMRIIAGSVLLDAAPSFWLLAFSMFLFLSLAIVKRHTELRSLLGQGRTRSSRRSYEVDDLHLLESLGSASGYQSILVLALYINSSASEALYRHPQALWLLCPLLLYWISRLWMIAHRGLMTDDPMVFALTDRLSQIIAFACAVVVIGAI